MNLDPEEFNEYGVPKVLYQYLPPPTRDRDTADILSARRFKLSRVGSMNDPFDILPVLKSNADPRVVREYLERSRVRLGIHGRISPKTVADWKARWDQMSSDPLRYWPTFSANLRLLCMSKRNNGILLWSHYASYHRGFAVGFNPQILTESRPECLFFEVIYDDERPVFDISSFEKEAKEDGMQTIFKRKSSEWSYEQEWRALQRVSLLDDPD